MVTEEPHILLVDDEDLVREGTAEMLREMGDEASKALFLHLAPGENANYPEGVVDDTHLVEAGAVAHAELFARELEKLDFGYLVLGAGNGQLKISSQGKF